MLRYALWALALVPGLAQADESAEDPVLEALELELERSMEAYSEASPKDAPLYFLGYRVTEVQQVSLSGRYGTLQSESTSHRRILDVSARVGDYELDSTHPVRGRFFSSGAMDHSAAALPIDGDVAALRTKIWHRTAEDVRSAQQAIVQVRANRVVKVEEDDLSADFSREEPVTDLREPAELSLDVDAWREKVVALSAKADANPAIDNSFVGLSAQSSTKWIVTSEGTRIRQPRQWLRISMQATATADDGDEVSLYRWTDVHSQDELPADEELEAWADQLAVDLGELKAAPRAKPYTGPLILRGRAAGVFVHEVMGHRVEGHRQKDEDEGQTFRDKVGQKLLPEQISIFDDPTLAEYAGFRLNGHYAYDEEGVPAQRAVLVDKGVFQGFLMSRSPIEGFDSSNGHGRAQEGRLPVARMANTIVETTEPVPYDELRALLLAEAEAQGQEYALVVDELAGGFTMTGRTFPNSFNVLANTTWKVYVDGRPDELVRGIDLVGTPSWPSPRWSRPATIPACSTGSAAPRAAAYPTPRSRPAC